VRRGGVLGEGFAHSRSPTSDEVHLDFDPSGRILPGFRHGRWPPVGARVPRLRLLIDASINGCSDRTIVAIPPAPRFLCRSS
jgi:hypothetical protein